MSDNNLTSAFNDWFDELEGYSFRSERFWDDFDYAVKAREYDLIRHWLFEAFKRGYEYGTEDKQEK